MRGEARRAGDKVWDVVEGWEEGGQEGLTTQVSLRAAHSINSTYPQYPLPCAQLATTTGNRFSGRGKNHVLFCSGERVPNNNKQLETVTLKIRGPIF
jgi:hypothetical protein